jgi:uncharacterized membrane protein
MIQRQSFLSYHAYRYLKLAGLLVVVALFVYWTSKPSATTYGGTWFGYASGIVSALIVLLLAWYGIRRRRAPRVPNRRHNDRRKQADIAETALKSRKPDRRKRDPIQTLRYGGTLLGWLSAHIYLGTALLVIASLHSGWRMGWNIHTLAYLLMLLVIASGMYGAQAYLSLPRRMTENTGDHQSLADMLLKLAELDELARVRALGLPEEAQMLVARMREGTRIGGTLFQQLSGRQADCPTSLAVEKMGALGKVLIDGDQPRLMRDLYSVLLQKQRLVERARTEIRLNAYLKCWLYLHAPLSIALLAALFGHVMTILIY